MTPRIKRQVQFTLDPDLILGLDVLKERDGVSASESVRRALREYLEAKGAVTPRKAKREKKS